MDAMGRGDLPAAQRLLYQALDAGADPAEVHFRLALVQIALGTTDEAADSLELATHFRPDFARAWLELSALRLGQARFRDALRAAESAVACEPGAAEARNRLGLALRGLGRFEEASQAFSRALDLDPADHSARANLGQAFKDLGRPEAAVAQLEAVLHDDPDDHEVRLNLALTRLASGDFRAGWRDYEKRWLHRDAVRRSFDFPAWDGSPLEGRTLLVYAEQGLGDHIMFACCVPDVLAMPGRCVLECSPRLAALFQRSFPQAIIVPGYADRTPDWRTRLPPIDCQIAIGSLPGALGFDSSSFPRPGGYLRPDAARVAHWKSVLRGLGPGLKVGISWRGGAERTQRGLRSVEIAQLAALWRLRGCQYVSLQYGDVEGDLEALWREFGIRLYHWPEVGADLDETAALVCALDRVVSVTTTVVHLAGALGTSAWVMVPFSPAWPYLMRGERMPWYPRVKLFRQPAPLDWTPVVESVAREIEGHLL